MALSLIICTIGGSNDDEKVKLLIEYVRGMNDKLQHSSLHQELWYRQLSM